MGKIRILHMTPYEINNGVYRYIFNHMEYIDQDKYRFEFLTRNKDGLTGTEEYKKHRFNIWHFENTQRGNMDGLRGEISRILGNGFDALHLHTSTWVGFLIEEIAMEIGIPQVIVHSHSTGIDCASDVERARLLEVHEKYKRQFSMDMATDVCACSRLAGEWLYGENIPRERVKILPNAIDVEKYHFNPEKRKRIRSKLGINDRVVVGTVGRYSYQKNQEFLIRAFAKAYRKNRSLFLVLIGQGELKGYLSALINELGVGGSAVCMDWQENVCDYLQAFDVFCLPSRFEGLGISAIEAQAAGLECYVSDNVPDEAAVTGMVKYLPLEEEIWEKAIAESRINGEREWHDREIAGKGYDIRNAAEMLAKIYK